MLGSLLEQGGRQNLKPSLVRFQNILRNQPFYEIVLQKYLAVLRKFKSVFKTL
jgi:hypothetical protein